MNRVRTVIAAAAVAAAAMLAAGSPARGEGNIPTTRPAAPPPAPGAGGLIIGGIAAPNGPGARGAVVAGGGAGLVINAPINVFTMQQRQAAENQKQLVNGMTVSATYKLQDLVRIMLVDNRLVAETSLAGSSVSQQRIQIEGCDASWLLNCQNARLVGPGARRAGYVMLCRYDFDQVDEGRFWQATLNLNGDVLTVNGSGVGINCSYNQLANMCHLGVTTFKDNRPQGQAFSAPNLGQLYSEHPEEVRRYLAPLLRRLSGRDLLRPGAADVYGAFAELPAEPSVAQAIRRLLPRLDAESFAERDAASAELTALGPAAVQCVLKLDRNRLSEEQKGRIDALIDSQRWRTLQDSASLRRDVPFLLDCLADDDLAVRCAAKAALEQVIGRPVEYDTSLPPSARPAAVEALWKLLRGDGNVPRAEPVPLRQMNVGP